MAINVAALRAAAEDFFETDVLDVRRLKKGGSHAVSKLKLRVPKLQR